VQAEDFPSVYREVVGRVFETSSQIELVSNGNRIAK